jgi:hypothetical protein
MSLAKAQRRQALKNKDCFLPKLCDLAALRAISDFPLFIAFPVIIEKQAARRPSYVRVPDAPSGNPKSKIQNGLLVDSA